MHVSSCRAYESLVLYSVYTKLERCTRGHYIDRKLFFTIPQSLTIITFVYISCTICIRPCLQFKWKLCLCVLCWRLPSKQSWNWDHFITELAGGQLLLMSLEERGSAPEISLISVAVQSCPWIMWSAGKLQRTHWESSNLETLHLIQLTDMF